ncbi:MAG: GIY-YIG nuclease family protein [Patescibacteria group bacterium]
MVLQHWYVYMVRCADGSLYTGVSTDLERRFREHNAGTGAAYTRSRLPVKLAYHEEYMNESDAKKREAALKKLTKPQKEKIAALNPAPK